MKKIVILTDSICKIGGIESLIHLKSNYWAGKGHEIHIITTEQKGRPSFFEMDSRIVFHDLSIDYNRSLSYFGLKNLPKVIKNYFSLQRILNKINPDLAIVANHIPVTFFFTFFKTRAKWIKEFHFSKFYRSKLKVTFFGKYEKYLESKYDYLIVLNSEERSFYNSSNVITIPNPIKITLDKEPIFNNRKPVAMAAGRLSFVKRIDVLIEIWSEFVRHNEHWKLEIYGNGEEEYVNSLKDKIGLLGLENRISFMGSVSNIQERMSKAGIYLMTSEQECFPMVLLEAQSAGLPIISFDCPTGPRNILTNGHDGILVPYDNNGLFLKKLIELSANEEQRIQLAKNGYENSKKYSLEKVMSIWDEKIINKT